MQSTNSCCKDANHIQRPDNDFRLRSSSHATCAGSRRLLHIEGSGRSCFLLDRSALALGSVTGSVNAKSRGNMGSHVISVRSAHGYLIVRQFGIYRSHHTTRRRVRYIWCSCRQGGVHGGQTPDGMKPDRNNINYSAYTHLPS